jgi:hypothetical protein
MGGFSDAVVNVTSAFLANNNQRFIAEVEAIDCKKWNLAQDNLKRPLPAYRFIRYAGFFVDSRGKYPINCLFFNFQSTLSQSVKLSVQEASGSPPTNAFDS